MLSFESGGDGVGFKISDSNVFEDNTLYYLKLQSNVAFEEEIYALEDGLWSVTYEYPLVLVDSISDYEKVYMVVGDNLSSCDYILSYDTLNDGNGAGATFAMSICEISSPLATE